MKAATSYEEVVGKFFERAASRFLIFVIGIAAGYGWRMIHTG
jgi:hypothetical protein